MDLEKIREVLEDDQLSPYQAKAYVAIFELRDASVSEVVEACSVPQPRIYDVLRSLDDKGFVETYEEDNLRVRANDPSDVIADLKTKSDRYADVAETMDDLWERPPTGEHDVQVFNEFAAVTDHAEAGIENATASVNVAARASTYLDLREALRDAKERGVVVNVSLYLDDNFRTNLEDMNAYFAETVTEVRHRESHAPFLTLIDGQRSYVGVPRQAADYGMAIHDQTLSTMLYGHFQHCLWAHWESVYSDRSTAFPREFMSIRNCVSELEPALDRHDDLRVTVNGFETDTGRERRVEGRIIDVTPSSRSDDAVQRADRVAISLENDGEIYTVGGFGAVLEDVRATWIRVEAETERQPTQQSA